MTADHGGPWRTMAHHGGPWRTMAVRIVFNPPSSAMVRHHVRPGVTVALTFCSVIYRCRRVRRHPHSSLPQVICQVIFNPTIIAILAVESSRACAVVGVDFVITRSAIPTRKTVAFVDFYKDMTYTLSSRPNNEW